MKAQRRKASTIQYFDRGSKELPELQINETVCLQPSKQDRFGCWTKGKVLRKAGVRWYIVRREDWIILRRNRRFLRTSKETFDDIDADVPEAPSPTNKEQSPGTVEPQLTDTSIQRTPPNNGQIFSSQNTLSQKVTPPYSGHLSTTDDKIGPMGVRYMEVPL